MPTGSRVWPDPLPPDSAVQRWRRWLAHYLEGVLDVLFPPRCAGCGRPGNIGLCAACWRRVVPVRRPYCPRCGQPTSHPRPCPTCRAGILQALDLARAAALYRSPLKDAIHAFKYRRDRRTGEALAAYMAARLRRAPLPVDVVVPVPLHPRRQRRRGFNQAALLAQAVAQALERPLLLDVLERVRATPPQVTLPWRERRTNMQGAFACRRPAAVRGRHVLLVDDVMTTGSTLEACATALKEAGARGVWGYVLARAVYRGEEGRAPEHPRGR